MKPFTVLLSLFLISKKKRLNTINLRRYKKEKKRTKEKWKEKKKYRKGRKIGLEVVKSLPLSKTIAINNFYSIYSLNCIYMISFKFVVFQPKEPHFQVLICICCEWSLAL